jgi:SpoVK/Ycf46/Vps4 family AAA+-type ATPase
MVGPDDQKTFQVDFGSVRRPCSQGLPILSLTKRSHFIMQVVGETERRLADIFRAAKQLAPCFIVLDNLDTIFMNTDSKFRRDTHTALDRLLSTLLVEIDGINASDSSLPLHKV